MPTPPTPLSEAVHTDPTGRLTREITVPSGMTLQVEPDGVIRMGGANGWMMSFGALSGQLEMEWPQGNLTWNAGSETLDFSGTIRANKFEGLIEGNFMLADDESALFDASQIVSGTIEPARLPWPGGALESGLPQATGITYIFLPATPVYLRWESPDGLAQPLPTWAQMSQLRADLGVLSATTSLNWPAIAAGSESVLTLTVPGAATTSTPSVHLGWSAALPAGIVLAQAWVSAANTISIRLRNSSAATIDPPALTVRATVQHL